MTQTAAPAKNRAAAQLLADADALVAKISDTAHPMTKTEMDQAAENVRGLRARANMILEFTPEAGLAARAAAAAEAAGGVAIPAPDGGAEPIGLTEQLAQYNKDFGRVFRSMAGFARAGRGGHYTAEQSAVLRRGQRILAQTRATDDVIIGDTGDPSGGEFLLPLQQEPSIFRVQNVLGGVLAGAQKYNALGRTLRIPYIIQDSAAGGVDRPLAGIANITIIGEGVTKPQQDPKFEQRLLTIYKAAAISKIGDEVMADDLTGGQLPATVVAQVGGQCVNFANELLTFTGSGTSEPLGALHANNGALIVVNRGTTQKISVDDVLEMYSKFAHGPDGVWLHSRSAFPELMKLSLSGNTLVTYLQNLNDQPGGRSLFGYPLVLCDILPQLGVKGDLALVNPAYYAAAIRQQLTVQSSIHVEFVNDITTWRFIFRFGGIPIPTSTYAYKAVSGTKQNEFSPFVILGDATTS